MEIPVEPVETLQGYRLSPPQQRLWSLQGRSPDPPFRFGCRLWLEGELDVELLWRALDAVVDRHEILRTRFARLPEMAMPVQVVEEPGTVVRAERRYEAQGTATGADLDALVEAWRARPIDAGSLPVLRALLVRRTAGEHELSIELPALASDSRSMVNLAAELIAAYRGAGAEDSQAVLQYPDAAEWQNELVEAEDTDGGRSYWRSAAASGAAPAPVPFALAGTAAVFRPRRTLAPEGAFAALDALAAGCGVDPETALLAAWAGLLARHSGSAGPPGEAGPLVGVAFEGRRFDGLAGALGPFARYLPVRPAAGSEAPFSAWARAVGRAVSEVGQWQEYFDPAAAPPLPGAGFDWLDLLALGGPADGAPAATLVDVYGCAEPFAARLAARRRAGGDPRVELVCDAGRLDERAAACLLDQLAALLEAAAADPERRLEDLPLLSDGERRRLLTAVPTAAAPAAPGGPEALPLNRLFRLQAARTPDAVAVACDRGEITYLELERAVVRSADALRRRGVGPEVRVALLADRSPELVTAVLAVLEAGGAFVSLDPSHPADRLRALIEDSGAALVLTDQAPPPDLAPGTPWLPLDGGATGAGPPAARPGTPLEAAIADAEQLAYVLYTSGSTGRPKGVMVPHRAIANRVVWMTGSGAIGDGDAVLWKTPPIFDASLWELFAPLAAGGRVVVAEPDGHRDAAYLSAAIESQRVTVVQFVPSLLRVFLDQPGLAVPSRLRAVYCGGEELTPDLVARCAERLPGVELHNLYGPTEVAIDATHHPCDPAAQGTVPIGRPIAGASAHVLDRDLEPVAAGLPGELWVGGRGVGRGYLGRPARTAAAFLPDPFAPAPGGRLYRTGDRARRRPDDALEYLGRIDQQVKVRGVRIEPGEIEAVLRAHPLVRDAVAMPRTGASGEAVLTVWVVPAGAGPLDVQELAAFAARRLPESMRPAAWAILNELPRTAGGKIDRAALPEPAAPDRPHRPPRTPEEAALAAIWSELLGVEQVGLDDRFFALGGDSILSLQVVNRAAAAGLRLNARQMFQHRTLEALAAAVTASGSTAEPSLERVSRELPPVLSFPQERLWFLDQVEPGSAAYNIPFALDLRGGVEVAAVRAALGRIVERHEVLRTTFRSEGGRPRPVIAPWRPPPVPVIDLCALPAAPRRFQLDRVTLREAALPFDLERGPVLRFRLLRFAPDGYRAQLTVHHIAGDGWSMNLFTREMVELYRATQEDRPAALPPLPVQYTDYAHWQRRRLGGEAVERLLGYWRSRLAGSPEELPLPTVRPRGEAGVESRVERLALPAAVAGRLKELARDRGATLFTVVVAAFKAVLRHLGAGDDLVVGTDVANREVAETEVMIGFFVNQIVLRTDLSGDPTFGELVDRVGATVREALEHKELPFSTLVKVLAPRRELGRQPMFQVKLVLQNHPMPEAEVAGVHFVPIEVDSGTAKFDLLFNLAETGDGGLGGWLEYRTGLFAADAAGDLLATFEALVAAVAERPETPLSEADGILGRARRERRERHDAELERLRLGTLKRARRQAVRA
jgi:amino acid adenylation domain-containing protein